MTVLATNPQLRLDGLIVATYAHGLGTIGGLDVIAGRRSNSHELAYHPGTEEIWDEYPQAKVRTFDVWALPNDADGNVTFANGPLAHLRANIDQLQAILAKRDTFIDVELDVFTATGTETRSGRAKVVRAIEVGGRRIRTWSVSLMFPFPYWNVLPEVDVNGGVAFTGAQSFTVGGGARVHDITVTASGDGTITHTQTGNVLTIAGSVGSVVISTRAKTVTDGGAAAPGVMVPSHGGWLWMDPGTNELVVSGASMSVSYFEARE